MLHKYFRPADTLVARIALKDIGDCIFEGGVPEKIKECMSDIQFRNALYLGSPDLCDQLKAYIAGEVPNPKKKERIENAFTRYLNRMSTRCTPFGLFVAVGTVQVEQEAAAAEGSMQPQDIYIDVKLDAQLVEQMVNHLLALPGIKKHLRYKVNETAWQTGEFVKYVTYYQLQGKRIHSIEKADLSAYLEKIIACNRQWLSVTALKRILLEFDASLTDDDMDEYVHELINAHILLSELTPSLTGITIHEHLKQLLQQLHGQVTDTNCHHIIRSLLEIIEQVEALGLYTDLQEAILHIAGQLKAIGIFCDAANIVHIDTFFRKSSFTIPNTVIKEITRGVELMSHFSLEFESKILEQFKNQFETTYSGRAMPLLEVLDSETGIGYPANSVKLQAYSQLLEDINPPQTDKSENMEINWNKALHSFFLRKYIDCVSRQQPEIEITEQDAAQFLDRLNKLPPTFNVHFTLHRQDAAESGASPYLIQFSGWGGVSATNMITRFAHAHQGILELCREAATTEEKALGPDEILADICHIPDGSIINLLSRPVLRRYEIPYLAGTTLEGDHIVMPSDLSVYVKNNKIYLYSDHLQKVVKPILSCAHNFRKTEHPVYAFLCDIQKQGYVNGVHLNLGRWVNEVEFFPRVRYKNMILIPASWRLNKSFFENYWEGLESLESVRSRLTQKLGNVKAFQVEEGDNQLFVHTGCTHHWKMFLSYIKKNGDTIIKEFIHTPAQQTANQLVLSYFKTDAQIQRDRQNHDSLLSDLRFTKEKGIFFPGSEWLYVKLYTNPNYFDNLLADVNNLVQDWAARLGREPDYFFVKYYDTGHHLRWRIKTDEVFTPSMLLHDIQVLFKNKPPGISNIQLDTYVRERERYAPVQYRYIEQFFCADTKLIMSFLSNPEVPNDVSRLLFALRQVEEYLSYFGLNAEQALRFCSGVKKDFSAEYHMDLTLKKQLGKKCRELNLLNLLQDDMPAVKGMQEALRQACAHLTLAQVPWHRRQEITWSLLHMHINRLFNYHQRFYELIVYDFLEKRYDSRIARLNMVKGQI